MQVILLSRILEKLDRMEKRLDALESTAAQKHASPTKRPTKIFSDYIRVPEKADEILAQLHKWVDRTNRVKALVYIKAAKEARVLEHTPYDVAALEFPGHLGSQSLYYEYIGEPFAFVKDADIEEFKRAKATLKSLTF